MTCLYASDYGAAEPGFDPLRDSGALLKGFEAQEAILAQARNPGQLQAMQRVLSRGESIRWCDQGYGWTEGAQFEVLFAVILVATLSYGLWRLRPHRGARRAARSSAGEMETR
jgi:hypothetical protein